MLIKRGDIFYADLNPVVGSEQGGIRPVLVVQNNVGNRHSPTVIVVPISSVRKKNLPVHIRIRCSELPKNSTVLAEQIRTIDRSRLPKFGQAEYSDFMARVFADKLDEILESAEKQNFNSKNTEDIYSQFSSSKDAA